MKHTDGIRRKFREYLDDRRLEFPRGPRKPPKRDRHTGSVIKTYESLPFDHPVEWYYDGHLKDRPLYGILGLGKLSERWLNKVKFPTKPVDPSAIIPATRFYSEVRREMRNILSTHPIGKRISPKGVDAIRGKYLSLCAMASETARELESWKCRCPLCGGGLVSRSEFEMIKVLVEDAVKIGVVPASSNILKFTHLTPTSAI